MSAFDMTPNPAFERGTPQKRGAPQLYVSRDCNWPSKMRWWAILSHPGFYWVGYSERATPSAPPFEDDPHTVGLTLRRLLDSGVERFYVGMGPLPAEVRRTLKSS